MDLLLILTYTAFCVAIFKIFKIPLNKWTVPTAVLGGVVLIGSLILLMNYNHPYSENSRKYFVTTPIVPAVKGLVTSVPVEPNQLLEQDDVLFTIDPTPFEAQLRSIMARITETTEDLERARTLQARGVGADRDVDVLEARLDDLNAQADLARFNLEHTSVKAPASGYVTQVTLRPGTMAVNFPFAPAMVFVSNENHFLVGWYRQNSALRLQPGFEAEVAFDAVPGIVFTGEVHQVQGVIAEGQVAPGAALISGQSSRVPGRIPVIIKITDPRYAQYKSQIPGGAYAQTAVYSDQFHHVAIMRRILLRMSSWMNYLFPFH